MKRAWLLLLLAASPLPAQEVRTAVVPEAITVGDVFHAVIRVDGAGERGVRFPDSLALPADLEMAGRRTIRRDTVGGQPRLTAVYPLAAWRPGQHTIPPAEVRIAEPGTVRAASAAFPVVVIRSVLPADTAGVQPKPAKDVLGGNRLWWPILLLALLLLLLGAALWYWYRRRRAAAAEPVPATPELPPRERALRALDAARARGAVEAGDLKGFYSAVSDALRAYVEALDARLGADLTSTELAQALHRLGRDAETADLRRVLQGADLVKFARRRPTPLTAYDEWQRARSWVERYSPAPEAEGEERAA